MIKKPKIMLTMQVILILLITANLLFIFFMSQENGEESSERSNKITDAVAPIIIKDYEAMSPPEKEAANYQIGFCVRKTAHMAEYASLSFLCTALLLTFTNKLYITLICPVAFSFLYAITDELLHQRFVDGRAGQFRDVLIDTLGALIGMLIMHTAYLIIKKVKSKKIGEANANNKI